ncbi:uncharacterized protein CPUR_03799 [Claviceps purpurea 20.1]|uniref:Uncharacterized protein n=1 Tax=Claviceps purpurea (strain 20.1) TaxID=1111077 RepID=M1VVQ9_CLAP2|nr:uncharacterized protein CPUR_03799 [Claviceps purpurea 20.1]
MFRDAVRVLDHGLDVAVLHGGKRIAGTGKEIHDNDVRLLQSRPWEWNIAATEEELARRLTEFHSWPVMVPEDEGQAWIEVPACDGLTEWATDVFRARERLALGFVSDLLDTVAMQRDFET